MLWSLFTRSISMKDSSSEKALRSTWILSHFFAPAAEIFAAQVETYSTALFS
jgi:hypothetical protein